MAADTTESVDSLQQTDPQAEVTVITSSAMSVEENSVDRDTEPEDDACQSSSGADFHHSVVQIMVGVA